MTFRPALFTAASKADLENARDWYEGKVPGLGLQLIDEVKAAVGRIETDAEQFAVVHDEARLCPTKRFPYLVVFRILGQNTEILAVMHGHRDPNDWLRRVSS